MDDGVFRKLPPMAPWGDDVEKQINSEFDQILSSIRSGQPSGDTASPPISWGDRMDEEDDPPAGDVPHTYDPDAVKLVVSNPQDLVNFNVTKVPPELQSTKPLYHVLSKKRISVPGTVSYQSYEADKSKFKDQNWELMSIQQYITYKNPESLFSEVIINMKDSNDLRTGVESIFDAYGDDTVKMYHKAKKTHREFVAVADNVKAPTVIKNVSVFEPVAQIQFPEMSAEIKVDSESREQLTVLHDSIVEVLQDIPSLSEVQNSTEKMRYAAKHEQYITPIKVIVTALLSTKVIAQIYQSVCMDMFAGLGSWGIAMALIGAKHVYFYEIDPTLCRFIKSFCAAHGLTNITVINKSVHMSCSDEVNKHVTFIVMNSPFGRYVHPDKGQEHLPEQFHFSKNLPLEEIITPFRAVRLASEFRPFFILCLCPVLAIRHVGRVLPVQKIGSDFDFPLYKRFSHHTKDIAYIKCALYFIVMHQFSLEKLLYYEHNLECARTAWRDLQQWKIGLRSMRERNLKEFQSTETHDASLRIMTKYTSYTQSLHLAARLFEPELNPQSIGYRTRYKFDPVINWKKIQRHILNKESSKIKMKYLTSVINNAPEGEVCQGNQRECYGPVWSITSFYYKKCQTGLIPHYFCSAHASLTTCPTHKIAREQYPSEFNDILEKSRQSLVSKLLVDESMQCSHPSKFHSSIVFQFSKQVYPDCPVGTHVFCMHHARYLECPIHGFQSSPTEMTRYFTMAHIGFYHICREYGCGSQKNLIEAGNSITNCLILCKQHTSSNSLIIRAQASALVFSQKYLPSSQDHASALNNIKTLPLNEVSKQTISDRLPALNYEQITRLSHYKKLEEMLKDTEIASLLDLNTIITHDETGVGYKALLEKSSKMIKPVAGWVKLDSISLPANAVPKMSQARTKEIMRAPTTAKLRLHDYKMSRRQKNAPLQSFGYSMEFADEDTIIDGEYQPFAGNKDYKDYAKRPDASNH